MARRKSKLDGMLSKKEKLIAHLSQIRFELCEESEEIRRSLMRHYIKRGDLTGPQWRLAGKLRSRHRKHEKLAQPKPTTFFVYAIQAGDAVKFGYSHDPQSRARAIQTGCPHEVKIVGTLCCDSRQAAKEKEKRLHRDARKYHLRGEWFDNRALSLFA